MLSIHHYIYYTILLRATIFTATLSSGQLNLFAERWYWPIGRCVGLCRFYLQNEIKARWGSAELERRRIMWQMWWHGAESKESSVHLRSFARLINKTYRSMIWSWHKIELSFKLRPFAIREPSWTTDRKWLPTVPNVNWRCLVFWNSELLALHLLRRSDGCYPSHCITSRLWLPTKVARLPNSTSWRTPIDE